MMPYFSTTLHPERDYAGLFAQLPDVQPYLAGQHPHRAWEYALALQAVDTWKAQRTDRRGTFLGYDVGGAGSDFHAALGDRLGSFVATIDPAYPPTGTTLAEFLRVPQRLADVVTCLSVVEHVPPDDLDQFLYHLGTLVLPGGLLILTADTCGCPGEHDADHPDRHHFHWMRAQMFTMVSRTQQLLMPLLGRNPFSLFGPHDLVYHGDHVYDYSFSSLVLRKRP